ncbi:MAG: metallophosphoesterase [Cytophagales bacterium]|nr:MAG: metallophosphoesterase [Cytophagales bacterium]TAF60171.1 MAG: metallophosphoesterase [Cytophagales bacterium]
MRIGLLSDTHGYLDNKVFEYFAECDEIWHAGDVGDSEVLKALQGFKPLKAVYGNIDGQNVRGICPKDLIFEANGLRVLMTHIAAYPPAYNPATKQLLKAHEPKLLVCGHSHILKVMPDTSKNLLYINPGAAGWHGFHKVRTLLRFSIENAKVDKLQVVELMPRYATESKVKPEVGY